MKKYRVAVLGCRARGTITAHAYHAHPRTEVVGLCDVVTELTDTLGEELGVSAKFTDLDKMIETTRPDIVAIPTGTEFHHSLAMRVLEHGVHIDVEKPICTTLEQADEVLSKADQKGVQVAVHHQTRVAPPVLAVWEAFESGRIGDLRYIYASGKGYYGGYGLLNIGTHILNNMIRFAGHCRQVSASATTNGHAITPEDVLPSPGGMGTLVGEYVTASLTFENDMTATLLQHRFPEVQLEGQAFELYGTEGRLLMVRGDAWHLPTPHHVPDDENDRWEALPLATLPGYDPDGTARLDEYAFVDEYVKALDEGRGHESSGAEGTHVLEIIMGIFESAAYGTVVDLPQPRRDHPLLRWREEAGLGDPADVPRDYYEWLAAEDARLGRTSPLAEGLAAHRS